MFLEKPISKEFFNTMIKATLNRKHLKEDKRKLDEINIDIDDDIDKSMMKNYIYKELNNNNDYIANYYDYKDYVNLSLTNKTKFMSNCFWKRVHQLLTSSLNKNDSKYRIFKFKMKIRYLRILISTINILRQTIK